MSRVEDLNRKLREATSKLHERQRDVEYWAKEVQTLNRELSQAVQDEARHASQQHGKAA